MKKMILTTGLITILTVSVFAVNAVAAEKDEDHSAAVVALVEEGVEVKEAKSIVAQAVAEAKKEGLKGKELSARVHEAVNEAKEVKKAEKKVKAASKEKSKAGSLEDTMKAMKGHEHPSKAKPKDHPAH